MKPLFCEPIQVPWELKPISSAETGMEALPDGRIKFWLRHDALKGVTLQMLVWWFKHIDGDIQINGVTYPRYRIWHPRDHIRHNYVKRCSDGSVGPGTIMRITEAFNRNPDFLIDNYVVIEQLDESGFAFSPILRGVKVGRAEYSFTPVSNGTLYENSMTIGVPWSRIGNRLVIPSAFPKEKGIAWFRHNIEEVGSFEHFLPELYAQAMRA